jgi:hypothetical protein
MDDFDKGFVIGLVIGEGSFTGDKKQPTLSIKLHARDPEPLQRLARLLGGRIFGPYKHGGRHYHLWHLRGPDLRSALPLFLEHLPQGWKRTQFEAWHHRYSHALLNDLAPKGEPHSPNAAEPELIAPD